jgi:predicted Fe-Mo cluster-binding NifX family protein
MIMKIAVITEDGQKISRHFGRAPYYKVFTIEDGKVISSEMREKIGHNQFGDHHHEHHGSDHGHEEHSHQKHINMAEVISDCQTLICGGMGMGAYESMRRLNITPLVTDLSEIDEVVRAFIDGKLLDHTELLH